MIYLNRVSLPADRPDGWPFSVPALQSLDSLTFDSPITLLAGENGCGKSTLLEALAVKMALPAIGRTDAGRDDSLKPLRPLAKQMKLSFAHRPINRLFLRSEDFFNFTLALSRERDDMGRELARVEEEYADRSMLARELARQPFTGSLQAMRGRYGEDMLGAASHGESFLRLFQQRLVPNGLYLLDEPEAPLSALRQLSLYSILKELSTEGGCQFLIATHSPILLAMEGATVYDLDQCPPAQTQWQELAGVSLLRSFLNRPDDYTRRL